MYRCEGFSADYLTTTGALWRGDIGKARFTVKVPKEHYSISFPRDYKLTERTRKKTKKTDQWTYVLETSNWTPKSDFGVFFATVPPPKLRMCPNIDYVASQYAKMRGDEACAGTEEHCALEKVSEEYFGDLSTEQARICRNMPYALHGYRFKDDKLHEAFDKGPGLAECMGCAPDAKVPGGPTDLGVAYLTPFDHFTPEMLSKRDLLYVRLAKLREEATQKEASQKDSGDAKRDDD
ncbi:MAG: YARHG domain-containing protein [Persicimonas sp.]